MAARPIYLGVGECVCGRIDELLYHPPDSPPGAQPLCVACLSRQGYVVPQARTADDLEFDDGGRPHWKDVANAPVDSLAHDAQFDLGHGHVFEAVLGFDEQLVGWLHTHPDGRPHRNALCQSFCAVRPLNGQPVHQVVCADPLTLSPSLLCRTCGAHGNIINGKWEPL